MGVQERIPLTGTIGRYEQVTILGVVLTVLGSITSWFTIEATAEGAAEVDDIDEGTTVLTGVDLSWGEITLFLAVVAAILLLIVVWRYHAAGRKTGLVVMLFGIIIGLIAVVGILLTGFIFSFAGEVDGVTIDLGIGILLTMVGALLMFSGGALRLASGAPAPENV